MTLLELLLVACTEPAPPAPGAVEPAGLVPTAGPAAAPPPRTTARFSAVRVVQWLVDTSAPKGCEFSEAEVWATAAAFDAAQPSPDRIRFRLLSGSGKEECALRLDDLDQVSRRSSVPAVYGAVRTAEIPEGWVPPATAPVLDRPPRPPTRVPAASASIPDDPHLGLALVCWPATDRWPWLEAGAQRRDLEGNPCDLWLVTGDAETSPRSYRVATGLRPGARLARAVGTDLDREVDLDLSTLVDQGAPAPLTPTAVAAERAQTAAPLPPSPAALVADKGANVEDPPSTPACAPSAFVAGAPEYNETMAATRRRFLDWAAAVDVPVVWIEGGELDLRGDASPIQASRYGLLREALIQRLRCNP